MPQERKVFKFGGERGLSFSFFKDNLPRDEEMKRKVVKLGVKESLYPWSNFKLRSAQTRNCSTNNLITLKWQISVIRLHPFCPQQDSWQTYRYTILRKPDPLKPP